MNWLFPEEMRFCCFPVTVEEITAQKSRLVAYWMLREKPLPSPTIDLHSPPFITGFISSFCASFSTFSAIFLLLIFFSLQKVLGFRLQLVNHRRIVNASTHVFCSFILNPDFNYVFFSKIRCSSSMINLPSVCCVVH